MYIPCLLNDYCSSNFSTDYSYDCIAAQLTEKAEVRSSHQREVNEAASKLKARLPACLQRAVDLAQKTGASSWLTSLPIEKFGFTLHKSTFCDAIALKYGWSPLNIPSHCSWGSQFFVQHALSCPKCGFPTLHHNEVRDLTATLVTEVCHEVCIEPHLQPLSSEALEGASAIRAEGARLDVAVNGFRGVGMSEPSLMYEFLIPCPVEQPADSHLLCKHETCKKRA